jgi:alpha-pyrone synthase
VTATDRPPAPARIGAPGVVLAGIGVTHPAPVTQDELWTGFFARHYRDTHPELARRLFRNAGVRQRHAAVNPLVEDASGWSTGRRMQRYPIEALPMGKAATVEALTRAGLAPDEVGLFAVCSCTGYTTPGLDILLARDLGLAADTQRLFVGHMGCYAALPGLGVVADHVRARGRPALLLCLELTSLHVQPADRDPRQVVSHALFSDAAAAVVLRPSPAPVPSPAPGGYELLDIAARTDVATCDYMTWEVTDLGFRMGVDHRVPEVLRRHVEPLVSGLLAGHGLAVTDVGGWAVHPGGPRILDAVRDGLGLAPERLAESREALALHGNCSSPTVLMILESLRPAPGAHVVALAFGPGLTLYAALLRAT